MTIKEDLEEALDILRGLSDLPFVDGYRVALLKRQRLLDRIDKQMLDTVEAWHKSDSPLSLHEYLGMTKSQYKYWVWSLPRGKRKTK